MCFFCKLDALCYIQRKRATPTADMYRRNMVAHIIVSLPKNYLFVAQSKSSNIIAVIAVGVLAQAPLSPQVYMQLDL